MLFHRSHQHWYMHAALESNELRDQFFDLLGRTPSLFEWISTQRIDGLMFGRLSAPQQCWCSESFARLLGHGPDHSPQSYLHPADSEAWQSLLQASPSEGTLRYRHADGSLRSFMVSVRHLQHEDEPSGYYVLAHQLISEPPSSLSSLDAMVHAYPALFSYVLDAVGQSVIALDTDHKVQFWNRGAERIFGWKAEEVMGKDLEDRLIPAQEKQRASDIIDNMDAGQAWDGEFRLKRKNGELFPALVANRILRHPNGEVVGYIGVTTDISDLKRSQKALVQSSQSLELATRTAGLGIWEMDPRTEHLIWNQELLDIYELSREEFGQDAHSWRKMVHPDDMESASQELARIFEGEEVGNVRFRIKTRSGTVKHLLASGAPLFDGNGEVIKLIGINMDITRLIDLEETEGMARQLAAQNRELSQFAYLASHDMQEPLRTIHSYAQLLEKHFSEQIDPAAVPMLGFLQQASHQLIELVRALIDYHRLGEGREPAEVDTAALVSEVMASLKVQIEQSRAEFMVGALPVVHGYAVELRQLFQNLISNAIKFRAKDRTPLIRIEASQVGPSYQFSVADNGIGVPPAYQQKIFQIFQRLHGREAFEGQGIGLAFCKKIIDLHHGDIWVDSAPDQGSTFYFSLSHDPS